MKLPPVLRLLAVSTAILSPYTAASSAETVAFWSFDEPVGMYPSSVMTDHGPDAFRLILGPGGSIVAGKFGNALSTALQPEIKLPPGGVGFGLTQLPTPEGRTVAPLSWHNARFAGLLTAGENHLRKEFPHPNPTATNLNLGDEAWTVEFWYRGEPAAKDTADAVVFEIGAGPRAENDRVTSLLLNAARSGFVLINQPSGTRAQIPSDQKSLTTSDRWTHLAFVYDAAKRQLLHFVDGRQVGQPVAMTLKKLPNEPEAYFSLARDGRWERPLPGAMDEFRISRGVVYSSSFAPPSSQVASPNAGSPARNPEVREPLRFTAETSATDAIDLRSSKHLLIDDALFPEHTNIRFVPTPPTKMELAFEVKGSFRKHLTVIEDENGVIRIYNPVGGDDLLGVRTSRDGLNFEIPNFSNFDPKHPNALTDRPAGTPNVFIDPLAPPDERWKLVSGDDGSGIYVHTSPDGFKWKRIPTAAISAWSGSQSNVFYDDQRGKYVGYHRSDIGENHFGKTERRFMMGIVDSLRPPWPFTPVSQAEYDRVARTVRLDKARPWYLDNGPITPGGVGLEWPTVFTSIDGFDPEATDIYVPKAIKYPWAPDTYLAFPCVYFHYEEAGPPARRALAEEKYARGSGPIETQLMTSRDGTEWKRHPRPVWIGLGRTDGFDIHQTYMAQGMVRRGDEIWMYSYNTEEYHSTYRKKAERRGVFRTVHLLDRFIAAEAPYDREATLYSRPFVFSGNKLELNVDTAATGWVQVGILQGDGRPLPGYGVDDCVFVSGNDLRYTVEWLEKGTDLSALAGKPVRLVIRMRGTKLFALQFPE